MLETVRDTRLARARAALAASGDDAFVVPVSADLTWLTGAEGRVTERLLALHLPREGAPFLIAPQLESGPLTAALPGLEVLPWRDGEDALARFAERAGVKSGTRLRLGEGLRVETVLRLTGLAHCESATPLLAPLRAVKDADELAILAEAAAHADAVVMAAAAHARPGMRECDLERFIFERFAALGDTDPWAIVASGPNSASPHHHTSDRVLCEGEVLLLDLGATTRGYHSDITRTFFLGEPSRQVLRVYEVVDAARTAGILAARAGAPAEDVDRAARGIIESADLGAHFTHRTGHGLGLEIHERPWLTAGETAPLEAGMVHSVEPGVYLEGRFGIRLEDIVVVEEGGGRRLNTAPLDLRPPRSAS